ncbi:hypothetical protein SAMN05216419_101521 [Nitrosomonas cryotolerans]|uniref:DUF2007 domain-containing protein n=1 Tax=Nitrosomonas cryotolerans ATCC 49181 TaxID=1131553 RepID=A0A1N6H4S8_9PROT|nr:DUF6164 family protein [Nitrosomonas cryotolerans]SFP71965.1 hypothetical protein SAMN05216419_101521 [Nitrosomonas cryotolerans]SIO14784.1 hypothetical protein SAMN02743940_1020 [Nitrosomonas cryotolerans ATCC 49181]
MSTILFRLNGVSDEEVTDVRELLAHNEIDFYETSPGNWGVSVPAIWLRDDDQLQKARVLLDEYQAARTLRIREEYARLKKEGKSKTFIDKIKESPIQWVAHLVAVLLVIYLSIKLVVDLGNMG